MCEFCIRHGEGKKWYEIMRHYSEELYHQNNREKYIKEFVESTQTKTVSDINRMIKFKRKMPAAFRFYRRMATRWMKYYHFGQVIPLEDAEMIVDMVQSVTRIPCVCRSALKGKKDARYCLALGIDPYKAFADYPELKAHLETMSVEEAKRLLWKFDEEGLVHSVWTFKTPFIGAICNCDHDCLAYRIQVANDLMQIMFKSEYLAKINPLNCKGCRGCQKVCQFGAIEFSVMDKKCNVNGFKCYGCGVCRSACENGAIVLEDLSMSENF